MKRRHHLFAALLCGCSSVMLAAPPAAVISSGGTLTKVGNNYDIPASLGVLKGGNLFQTFVQFDLTMGETATFGGASGLQNIFSRVTGGRSYIDGTIASPSPGVNLYFINANGITFGRHARLDVAGSFSATTADVLKFSDGGKFDALNPSADSLSSAPLSAYGFIGTQKSSIAVDYTQFAGANTGPGLSLAVPAGQTLSLIGGALSIAGGDTDSSAVSLQAPQGRLELAAVERGELKPTQLTGAQRGGKVDLVNVTLAAEGRDSQGAASGSLAMAGRSLSTTLVTSNTSGETKIRMSGRAAFGIGTRMYTRTNDAASCGNFSIRAGKVVIRDLSELGTKAMANSQKGARVGDVSVRAGTLAIVGSSQLKSTTSGGARAGNVSVQADTIDVHGDGSVFPNGIYSQSLSTATGRSGNVTVRAGSLDITNGGFIAGDTYGVAHGGDVKVFADTIHIRGGDAQVKTGIFSDSNSAGAGGDGGDVFVRAGTLSIEAAGLISTKTVGAGKGGDTTVQVRDVYISRGDNPAFTGIAVDSATNDDPSLPAHFAGPGGNVKVEAQTALLVDGGQISASTQTQGKGGSVTVRADTLVVSGNVPGKNVYANISSDSRSEGVGGGDAGPVAVSAKELIVSEGGRISSTSYGEGSAGAVQVRAETALLSGSADSPVSGILAAAASKSLPGPGGTVRTEFGDVVISGTGVIAANTQGPGIGGDIIVRASSARIVNGGKISADTSGTGRGGSVDVTAGLLSISAGGGNDRTGIFSDSSATGPGGMAGSVRVTATVAELLAGGSIAASSNSTGTGGSVNVTAERLKLSGASSVAASATGKGDAGSVEIHVSEPLELLGQSGVRTTSAKSDAGTVLIESASDINIEEGSSVTVQALTGNAGRIALMTPHRLLVRNSTLLAEAGLNGGDIFIDPEYIVLDHGIISANAVNVGGNILLVADNFLPSSTPITATGSTAGTVQISAPQLDLSGALASLTAQLVDASLRFQERCAMRLGGEVSSFLVLGRGGVEDSPADPAIVLSRRKTWPTEEEKNRAR